MVSISLQEPNQIPFCERLVMGNVFFHVFFSMECLESMFLLAVYILAKQTAWKLESDTKSIQVLTFRFIALHAKALFDFVWVNGNSTPSLCCIKPLEFCILPIFCL